MMAMLLHVHMFPAGIYVRLQYKQIHGPSCQFHFCSFHGERLYACGPLMNYLFASKKSWIIYLKKLTEKEKNILVQAFGSKGSACICFLWSSLLVLLNEEKQGRCAGEREMEQGMADLTNLCTFLLKACNATRTSAGAGQAGPAKQTSNFFASNSRAVSLSPRQHQVINLLPLACCWFN